MQLFPIILISIFCDTLVFSLSKAPVQPRSSRTSATPHSSHGEQEANDPFQELKKRMTSPSYLFQLRDYRGWDLSCTDSLYRDFIEMRIDELGGMK